MNMINDKMSEMESYAIEYDIPIMQQDAIAYINRKIDVFKLYEILELGTAIGYSTINFASNPNVKITSIERDENRYEIAVKNVNEINYNDRIKLLFSDINDVNLTDKYDLVIIDASKAKNKDFFEKFSLNLKENGFIIIDNMNFHGLVGRSAEIESKNLRRLVSKIEEFKEYLKVNKDFFVEFIEVGDGLAVCQKK